MNRNKYDSPIYESLRIGIMLELGIVPIKGHYGENAVAKALAGMDREEARKFKRKFRKLWRKKFKELAHIALSDKSSGKHKPTPSNAVAARRAAARLREMKSRNADGARPSQHELSYRKMFIAHELEAKLVDPVFERLMTATREREGEKK